MSPRSAEIYDILNPNTHEWATICIDEKTGTFLANSSFGRFAYNWRAIGTRTLKEFLAGLNFDYFMGKAYGPGETVFDGNESVAFIRKNICETRRRGDCTKNEARGAWEAAEYIDTDNEQAFYDSLWHSKPLDLFYNGDIAGLAMHKPNPQCVGFWEDIWPLFLEQIKAPAQALSP